MFNFVYFEKKKKKKKNTIEKKSVLYCSFICFTVLSCLLGREIIRSYRKISHYDCTIKVNPSGAHCICAENKDHNQVPLSSLTE